jgi:hypothetical protein
MKEKIDFLVIFPIYKLKGTGMKQYKLLVCSVADPGPGSSAFLLPWIRYEFFRIRDEFFRIRDELS